MRRICGRKDALTAIDWGLVNEVVPANELDAAIERKTTEIAGKSPAAIRCGKSLFYRQQGMELDAAYEHASEIMAQNMMAADAAEGIDAFLGKRQPLWSS